MANPRAFISFDYDNNLLDKNLFVGQIKNSMTPFSVEDWSSKEILLQSQWERLIKEKIRKCHLMIVLIGNSMASATGVKKEIRFANEQDVPCFGVYVGTASITSTLPTGLTKNRTIRWDWHLISSMVDRMMREGKNTAQGKRS